MSFLFLCSVGRPWPIQQSSLALLAVETKTHRTRWRFLLIAILRSGIVAQRVGFGYHLSMRKSIKNLLTLTLCLGLAGCARIPQSVYIPPSERQQAVSQLTAWQAQGSLSVWANGQHNMMSFSWAQAANNLFTIRFSDFTYSVIVQDHHGALTMSKPIQGIDPSLLESLVDAQYWLRGLPLPLHLSHSKVFKRYDHYGHLNVLQQNGWLIQYQNYVPYLGYDLPMQIIISGQHAQLKIVIKRWGLVSNQPSVSDAQVELLRSL